MSDFFDVLFGGGDTIFDAVFPKLMILLAAVAAMWVGYGIAVFIVLPLM